MRDYGILSLPLLDNFRNPLEGFLYLQKRRLTNAKKELLLYEDKKFLLSYEVISTVQFLKELELKGENLLGILNFYPCEELERKYGEVLKTFDEEILREIGGGSRINEKVLFIRFVHALLTALVYCGEDKREEALKGLIEPLRRSLFDRLLAAGKTITGFKALYDELTKSVEELRDTSVLLNRFSLRTALGFWLFYSQKGVNWEAYAKDLENEVEEALRGVENSKKLSEFDKKILKFRVLYNYKRLKDTLKLPVGKGGWGKFPAFETELEELRDQLRGEISEEICSSDNFLLIKELLSEEEGRDCVLGKVKGKTLSQALENPLFEEFLKKEARELKALREKVLGGVDLPESFYIYKSRLELLGLTLSPEEEKIFDIIKGCEGQFKKLRENVEFSKTLGDWNGVLKLVKDFEDKNPQCVKFYSSQLREFKGEAERKLKEVFKEYQTLWERRELITFAKRFALNSPPEGSELWELLQGLKKLLEEKPWVETYYEGEKYLWVNKDKFTLGRVEGADFEIHSRLVPRVLYTFERYKGSIIFKMKRVEGKKFAKAKIDGLEVKTPLGEEYRTVLNPKGGRIEINDGVFINYRLHPSGLVEVYLSLDRDTWSFLPSTLLEDFEKYTRKFLVGKVLF